MPPQDPRYLVIPFSSDPDSPLKEYFGLSKPMFPDEPNPPAQPQPTVKRPATLRKVLGIGEIESISRQIVGADASLYDYENPDPNCGVWWDSFGNHDGETRIDNGGSHWMQKTNGNVTVYVGFESGPHTCVRSLDVTIKVRAQHSIVSGGSTYIANASWYQVRRYQCADCTIGALSVETLNTTENLVAYYYLDGDTTGPKLPGVTTGKFKALNLISYETTDGSIGAHDFTDPGWPDGTQAPIQPSAGVLAAPYAVSCCTPLSNPPEQ